MVQDRARLDSLERSPESPLFIFKEQLYCLSFRGVISGFLEEAGTSQFQRQLCCHGHVFMPSSRLKCMRNSDIGTQIISLCWGQGPVLSAASLAKGHCRLVCMLGSRPSLRWQFSINYFNLDQEAADRLTWSPSSSSCWHTAALRAVPSRHTFSVWLHSEPGGTLTQTLSVEFCPKEFLLK